MKLLLLAILIAALGACASVSYGEFYGKSPPSSSPDMHDLAVVWVDDVLVFNSSVKPVVVGANVSQKLEPGRHELLVRSLKSRESPLVSLSLTVEPCTRYNFVAKDTGDSTSAVSMGETPIPDCKH